VDFELNEDQQMMRDAAREFAEKRLLPNAARYDEEERLPDELFAELAELGYMGMLIPEEYGGMGLDPISYACIVEEFAAACAGLSITLSVHNSLIGGTILAYGSEELKKTYLPRVASGDIGSYCLTEPGAGSDAAAIRTTAKRSGDSYVINGEKIFATSADYSKLYLAFCLTEPGKESHGISLFLIERDTPGVQVGKKEKKLGIRCSDTRSISFTDVRIPVGNMLGQENDGYKIALARLDHGRLGVAAQSVGIAEAAYAEALKYSKERKQFNRPISDFQAIAFKLADMRTRIDAARWLTYRAFSRAEKGERFSLEAAEAKLFASETANFVANEAVQIHGGYGYMKEYAVERYFRDARVTEIYEGTSEVQRIVISRHILREDQ
jgi:alkylation response protein AidB-like acyl-CoA dehydrogenase